MKFIFGKINPLLITLTLLLILPFSCKEKTEQVEKQQVLFQSGPGIKVDSADAQLPFLFAHNNKLYLSWVENSLENSKLYFSQMREGSFGSPQLVAEGEDWFVNWADYPQITAFKDGSLMAVFLKKSGPGTFSYDIMYSVSKNFREWSKPKILHDDQTQTEHGFVSMSPWEENILITWLDGRDTQTKNTTATPHHHHGQMTLRAAVVNNEGHKLEEWLLDDRVCDCCQTGSTVSNSGPLVVFRDRSENEIRDIGLVRWNEGEWNQTQPVHMDLWEIAACPVNGPRISSLDSLVSIAWFTASMDQPAVNVAFSKDSGATFDKVVRSDLGNPIGRVAVEILDENTVFILWMENNSIMGRTVDASGRLGTPLELTESATNRSSGFPQMKKTSDKLWFAWTVGENDFKEIQTASISIQSLIHP